MGFNSAFKGLTELEEKLVNLEKSRPSKGWDKGRVPRKVLKLKFKDITFGIIHKKRFGHFLDDVGMRERSR